MPNPDWFGFRMNCPGCGEHIDFWRYGSILVNAETTQHVEIPGLWELSVSCKNPFCKWSVIKGTALH